MTDDTTEVHVTLSHKHNMGNYENIEVEIGVGPVTVQNNDKDIKEETERLRELAREQMQQEILKQVKQKKQQKES